MDSLGYTVVKSSGAIWSECGKREGWALDLLTE